VEEAFEGLGDDICEGRLCGVVEFTQIFETVPQGMFVSLKDWNSIEKKPHRRPRGQCLP